MEEQPSLQAGSVLCNFSAPVGGQVTSSRNTAAATDGSAFLTDQFVLLDEAAKLPTRNQLAPLSQDQLRGEDHVANEDIWTNS